MPELPEVETVRRQLHARLQQALIERVDIWRGGRLFVGEQATNAFAQQTQGKTITQVERRGKLLIMHLHQGGALLSHLKMTGRWIFVENDYAAGKHDQALFTLMTPNGTGRLVWADVRKFGYVRLVDDEALQEVLARYGLEPLEHGAQALADAWRTKSTRTIKAHLLDQSRVTGVGNIYADEALFRAGIRPTRRVTKLSREDWLRLAQTTQEVLRASLEQRGTSANDYVDTLGERGGFLSLLQVYGREGEACVTCSTPIKRIVVGQRGTHFCPACQR